MGIVTRVRSNEETEIPLFLLPLIILKQIRKTGDRIYRISVKRTHWHHYNVSVRTKSLPRELAPAHAAAILPGAELLPGNRGVATGACGGKRV
jgi:hypothetical protein